MSCKEHSTIDAKDLTPSDSDATDALQENNLRLRPLSITEDVATAMSWYQDEDVLYFSEGAGTKAYDRDTVERMYRWLAARGRVYVIEIWNESGWVPIGDASLCKEMLPLVIGDPKYRSRGIGERVMRLLIAQARLQSWAKLRAHKIYAYNTRSIRLFEKCGFRRMGSGVDEHGRLFYQYELELA